MSHRYLIVTFSIVTSKFELVNESLSELQIQALRYGATVRCHNAEHAMVVSIRYDSSGTVHYTAYQIYTRSPYISPHGEIMTA